LKSILSGHGGQQRRCALFLIVHNASGAGCALVTKAFSRQLLEQPGKHPFQFRGTL